MRSKIVATKNIAKLLIVTETFFTYSQLSITWEICKTNIQSSNETDYHNY